MRLVLLAVLAFSFSLAPLAAQDGGFTLPEPSLKLAVSPSEWITPTMICIPDQDVHLKLSGSEPNALCAFAVAPLDISPDLLPSVAVPLTVGMSDRDGLFTFSFKIPKAARGMKYQLVGLSVDAAGKLMASKLLQVALD